MTNINFAKIEDILGKFSQKKILVVGDLGIDQYTIGEVKRISPEAPVPVLVVDRIEEKLGMAANVANNVKALGGTPLLAGVIGRDYLGKTIRRLLDHEGIDGGLIVEDDNRPTTVKDRITTESQQIVRVDREIIEPLSTAVEKDLVAKIEASMPSIDAVTFECYGKGVFFGNLAQRVIDIAHKHGKNVSLDPNPKSKMELFKGLDFLTPNTMEAEILSGVSIKSETDFAKAATSLRNKTSAKTVIITRGKDGMSIFPENSASIHIPTFAKKVFDVSGAGDTVIATMTLALCSGANWEEAAFIANHAAAVEVSKRGTATVSREEILADVHSR